MQRKIVVGVAAFVVVAALTLTGLGLRDVPNNAKVERWTPRAVAGFDIASSDKCTRCHTAGGAGPVLTNGKIKRDDQWIQGHIVDPEVIAPGIRPAPPNSPNLLDQRAVVAYVHKLRAGVSAPPQVDQQTRVAEDVFGTKCISCHMVDGDGGKEGPDLTHAAKKPGRDAAWFKDWISDPSDVDPTADMPAFGGKLTPQELDAISGWLAARK